jgi:DEAD/DEAH box helicase domain-containing protein
MLPAHIAENIKKQVLFYLQSTFSFRDKQVEKAFSRFLEDPETGIFKGPWIQLRRPFRPAPDRAKFPLDINIPFHPFLHQFQAWKRLSSKNKKPESTIVTTGTGSGKTECFLFPILDHCLRTKQKGQKGIKAIILYPMNALAADQEKRFAEAVLKDAALKEASIRVGNYTGRYDPAAPGSGKESGTKELGIEEGSYHGITNHAVQQENPPDILLTNYKMLDFLLMRPQDQNLWRFNEPGILKYLVLDELHTYDGAQGADVACLIRRLKERLSIPRGELCVVGTSATLDDRQAGKEGKGDGSADAMETGKDRLARFSGTLFEESIPPEAVVDEDRLEVEEIILPDLLDVELPEPSVCAPAEDEDALAYAKRQALLWSGPEAKIAGDGEQQEKLDNQWLLELGDWIKKISLFKTLLEVFHQAERNREDPLSWMELIDRLSRRELSFTKCQKIEDRQMLVASFIALVGHAREKRSGKSFPLVPIQVQLWIRELRRLGRIVSDKPCFGWLDEPVQGVHNLPAFQCSECGESGWIALHDPSKISSINAKGVDGIQLTADPTHIYRGWFGHKGQKSQYIVILSPWDQNDDICADNPKQITLSELEKGQAPEKEDHDYLCPTSLVVRKGDGPCPLTDNTQRFRVRVDRRIRPTRNGSVVGDQGCPRCGERTGIFFIGSQSATLSSVAIDEMFGSILNNDPKLLAFTDSVQDASHRAGFFTSRTYHFTFRTALQHIIDAAGSDGLPLKEAGVKLLEYWSQDKPGFPGLGKAMGALLPPDLHMYQPYLEYRGSGKLVPPKKLQDEVAERLTWEATSEFSLMQTHGRTMELSGTSCLGWDEDRIADTIGILKEKLPGIDPILTELPDGKMRLWIYGMLHRYRERGAVNHPYLLSYARQNFWGKYPFGRAINGRETYPSATRYKPKMLVTQRQSGHEFILAPSSGGQPPWHIIWFYRALEAMVPESSILDMLHAFLESGAEAGLLKRLHQDGTKEYYVIAAEAGILYSAGEYLVCSQSGRAVFRPLSESKFWKDAPSIEYYANNGLYNVATFSPRQIYYQDRYKKGALRRVVASEHTGLLATDERENLERDFAAMKHADDPNILTCTSTLEMGIDIGDLSSTMLCSVPPNTASYLQRIGRAGRATGAALIVSFVNQRPHDLFFYARPAEMLKGKVEPPGCWLDASAVLVRQYLGFCFDSATHAKILPELPMTGKQLVDDLNSSKGLIPKMMEWITTNENELTSRFLKRFGMEVVQQDTRDRFITETETDLLIQRIHKAANEHDRMRRDLTNARTRLQDQLKKLGEEEQDAKREIEQELRILKGRINNLGKTSALEILTDHGLLPNYAFPERGVRFYGAIYNKHRGNKQEHKPVEVSRSAGSALRELAPHNMFYTHSRQFEIQQIAIGNPQQPIIESWGICGRCGHMRRVEELHEPGASPYCPQCGHGGDHESQLDVGQQKQFVEFVQSQALSYMEHYESLSGDRNEERQREFYQVLSSFDQTIEAPVGAVGNDDLPFGIEYRAAMIRRDVNVGFLGDPGSVPFGPDQEATDNGFQICQNCGVVVPPGTQLNDVNHRRSCHGRRRYEKMQQEGRGGSPFKWENVYLYRQLRSEAIRLLLPLIDSRDINTLIACFYLGLRLRFEGNPAHLIIAPQVLPDAATGLEKHFLVLMDAVPGGTGYLKTLFQERNDTTGLEGEGIIEVLKLARDTLETCTCRKLMQQHSADDTDGCYRCIRTYHLQYNADQISRERGIVLLNQLIEAGERRVREKDLDKIKPDALFGSVLEKKFVDSLCDFVIKSQGKWETTIIKGGQGFRFTLPDSDRMWELELQPTLGIAQGVAVQSQPDFLLNSDDAEIKPIAIFADGFEYHCAPPNNRLADDMNKRRAIVESGKYHVWSVTWDDLITDKPNHVMVCHHPVANTLIEYASKAKGMVLPDARLVVLNGIEQLKAFLARPVSDGWKVLANFACFWPLQLLYDKRKVLMADLQPVLSAWRKGDAMASLGHVEEGDWIYNDKACLNQDIIAYISVEDVLSHRLANTIILGRLGDGDSEVSGSDFKERWRRFLACVNLYQFSENFKFWAMSEVDEGTAPEIAISVQAAFTNAWQEILDETIGALRPYVAVLAAAGAPVPIVEHYNDHINDDAFAELAWTNNTPPVAILSGDQADFASSWQKMGWKVITSDELQIKGSSWLVEIIMKSAKGE